jgi:hypothetical protein
MGTTSINDFKAIVMSNMVQNITITLDDIKIAESMFGPDVGALKVKQQDINQHLLSQIIWRL